MLKLSGRRMHLLCFAMSAMSLLAVSCSGRRGPEVELAAGFAEPKEEFRPWCYWWWQNGNADRETMTAEGMIKIVYELLKDKLNIAKLTFISGDNTASQEYPVHGTMDRCPLCGIALKDGVCPKCGYRKP